MSAADIFRGQRSARRKAISRTRVAFSLKMALVDLARAVNEASRVESKIRETDIDGNRIRPSAILLAEAEEVAGRVTAHKATVAELSRFFAMQCDANARKHP